jgi:hypothetical protein
LNNQLIRVNSPKCPGRSVKERNYILLRGTSQADMPLLKVVVSSTRNSTETVAALERDLDGHSPSSSTHDVDQELPDHSQMANEPSQVYFLSL